jgi:fatty-acyl-CoA synthase
MEDAARRVATSLLACGLKRGDLVALVINGSEPFLTAFFGVSLAGLVPASLYPPSTTSELPAYVEQTASILRHAGVRAVVTTSALKSSFDEMAPSCPELELVLACESLDAPARPIPGARVTLDDLAFVQFTSGSTSSPKGVALTHRSLASNIAAIAGPQGLHTIKGDVAVSWLPLFHDMGLVGIALGAMYTAGPAVLLSPTAFVKRPAEWLRVMTRHRGTISFAPNFAYDLCVRRVKDSDLEGLDLSPWRVAGCGAEPVHAPTLAAFADRFAPVGFRRTSFVPSYGLAEHVVAVSLSPLDRPVRVEEVDASQLTERRVATPAVGRTLTLVGCGVPLPGHRIRIVGENGRELRDREVGEIALAGPSVMLGYYKAEAMTDRTIRDGWLYTGDLGYTVDGELFVCGRIKDIIIVNGRKYHPQDLEWAVDQLQGVKRGRVVAFGTRRNGGPDRVVLVIEPAGTLSSEQVIDSARRRIGDLCGLYVDDVMLVRSGTIGRTTSGKVRRAATKELYERGELAAAVHTTSLQA